MNVVYYSRKLQRNVIQSFEHWALTHQKQIREIAAATPDVYYTLQVNEASNATLSNVDCLVRYGRRDWLVPGWGAAAPVWAIDLLESIVDGTAPRPPRQRKRRRSGRKLQPKTVLRSKIRAGSDLFELYCGDTVFGYCYDEPVNLAAYPDVTDAQYSVMYFLRPSNRGFEYIPECRSVDSFTVRRLANDVNVWRKTTAAKRPIECR